MKTNNLKPMNINTIDVEKAEYFNELLTILHPFIHMNGQKVVVCNPSDLPFSIDFFTFGTLIFSWRLLSKDFDASMNIDTYSYIFDDDISLFGFENMNNQVSFHNGYLHNDTIPAIRINGLYMYCLLGFFMEEKYFNMLHDKLSLKNNNFTYYNIGKLRELFKKKIEVAHNKTYSSDQREFYYYYNSLNGDNINYFLDIYNMGAWNE